jgi:hypothetical protein
MLEVGGIVAVRLTTWARLFVHILCLSIESQILQGLAVLFSRRPRRIDFILPVQLYDLVVHTLFTQSPPPPLKYYHPPS